MTQVFRLKEVSSCVVMLHTFSLQPKNLILSVLLRFDNDYASPYNFKDETEAARISIAPGFAV